MSGGSGLVKGILVLRDTGRKERKKNGMQYVLRSLTFLWGVWECENVLTLRLNKVELMLN